MLAADGGDLDRLADALRVDGVVVDQAMGSGEAEQAHDRIAEIVRGTPFPVYVALLDDSREVAGESVDVHDALAGLLHRRLGDEQALFVVDSPDGIPAVVAFGLGTDPALLSLSARADEQRVQDALNDVVGEPVSLPAVTGAEVWAAQADDLVAASRESATPGEYPPTLSAQEARQWAEAAAPLATRSDWRPRLRRFVDVRVASDGFTAMVSVLVGSVVALLVGQTLSGWPRRRPRATPAVVVAPTVPPAAPARDEARDLVTALAHDLAKADRPGLDPDLAERAEAARTAAEMLLDSDDVGDLLGAQALARTGRDDLRRARSGRTRSYRPCFFDPRHGGAVEQVGWRLGQGTVEVPCCRTCRDAVQAGGRPAVLHLEGRRGPVPYWDRDDVWTRTGFGAVTDTLARDVLRARERSR